MKRLDDMTEPELADAMTTAARAVKLTLPPGTGFVLLAFPMGRPGIAQYIGSCTREDVVRLMRETADRLERREDVPR